MCASNCGNCSTCAPDVRPGRRGPQGIPGLPNTLSFSITALDPGDTPTASVTGVSPNQHLAIGFPLAPSPVVSVLATTLTAGTPATATINNTDPLAPVITFGIPEGADGDDGVSAFSTLASNFVMPAVGVAAPASFVNNDWVNIGLPIQLGPTTWLICTSNPGLPGGLVTLLNPGPGEGYPTGISYNALAGSNFGAGTVVTGRGRDGRQGLNGAAPALFVDAVTTIPVAAPAAGGEIVVYYDNALTPTIVAFYAWDGAAWNASPNLIGPAGTIWQTTGGDPNVTLPSGPIGTFVLRTDVLSIYQRTSVSVWTLVGSLTPTFDQVWTASSGLTTRPQYYTPTTATHSVAGVFTIDLTKAWTVVDVQAAIELNYTALSNYGEWWLELSNSTGSSKAVTYTTSKWEKNTGATAVTSLAASGSPGDRVLLRFVTSKAKLTVTEFITPVAI
jgi:hypothetical protein